MTTGSVSITLLTQPECHYCDHAKQVLANLGQDLRFDVVEVDLGSPEGRALASEHGVLFAPGVLLDGQMFGYGRLSERRLRKALQRGAPDVS